jgi:hypothetical protein
MAALGSMRLRRVARREETKPSVLSWEDVREAGLVAALSTVERVVAPSRFPQPAGLLAPERSARTAGMGIFRVELPTKAAAPAEDLAAAFSSKQAACP